MLLLVAAPRPVWGQFAIESFLEPEPHLWTLSPRSFIKEHADHGFEWTSKQTDEARAYKAPLTFLQIPVWEAILRFSADRPRELSLSLYNRGDAGDLDRPSFAAKFQSVQARIVKWTQRRAVRRQQQNNKKLRRQVQKWRTQNHDLTLIGSYSTKDAQGHPTFRAEYIRVDITPRPQDGQASRSLTGRTGASSSGNTKKVVKSQNGGVYLEGVPMVDQGEKGYCAVATAERVFRYYGFETDQHELAQLASASSSGGTNPTVMLEALRSAGRKMGWRVKVLEEFGRGSFVNLLHQYNRLARRQDKPTLHIGRVIYVSQMYEQMDLELLKKARLKSAQNYRTFQTTVAGHIKRGKPLAWSVVVGKVPEEPPVGSIGGHMRLITGYHPKKGMVYYSDSWGAGHEHKSMRFDDAWAITTGLYVIETK